MSLEAVDRKRLEHRLRTGRFSNVDARELVEAGGGPAESHRVRVGQNEREIITHPSGDGFFTLDRLARTETGSLTRDLVVTEYALPQDALPLPYEEAVRPHLRGKPDLVSMALEHWKDDRFGSAEEPAFPVSIKVKRIGRPMRVRDRQELSVHTLRGATPVTLVFHAA